MYTSTYIDSYSDIYLQVTGEGLGMMEHRISFGGKVHVHVMYMYIIKLFF